MKKIIIASILIFSFVIVLSGCGEASIVGKWKDAKDVVEFKNDGKFAANYYWPGGTYIINGNQLTLSSMLMGNEEYTFEIKESNLILKKNDKTKYTFQRVK